MKIPITGGVLEIDPEDAPIVLSHSWYKNENGYAISRINGKLVRLHKLLTGTGREQHIDHAHGNGLDNRRSEIRMATRNQNMWNSGKKNRKGARITSSQFKGVNFDKRDGRWVAEVWKFGKKIFTKHFKLESDAAIAYNIVAKREFGEFAKLNDVASTSEDTHRVCARVESYKARGEPRHATISFSKSWGKWVLHRTGNGKKKYIGGFKSRAEAEEKLAHLNSQSTGGEAIL